MDDGSPPTRFVVEDLGGWRRFQGLKGWWIGWSRGYTKIALQVKVLRAASVVRTGRWAKIGKEMARHLGQKESWNVPSGKQATENGGRITWAECGRIKDGPLTKDLRGKTQNQD